MNEVEILNVGEIAVGPEASGQLQRFEIRVSAQFNGAVCWTPHRYVNSYICA